MARGNGQGFLRRRPPDPRPWTWEPAACVAVVVAAVVIWAPVLIDVAVDELAGDPATGVDDVLGHWADTCGSPLRLTVLAVLLVAAVVAVVATVRSQWWAAWTGRSRTGFATRAEVSRSLGLARLRAGAAQIRPDLYGRQPR